MGTQTSILKSPRRGRGDCAALDDADPLAALRDRFVLPDDVIYLDGNSLGALPRATASHVADVIDRQWGSQLIASWNSAGWIAAPRRVGNALAPLIGARDGEVVVADSTSINLYKVLTVALRLAAAGSAVRDVARNVVISEADNFPTDLYIAEGVLRQLSEVRAEVRAELRAEVHAEIRVDARPDGARLTLVPATASDARHGAIVDSLSASTAVLMLTHVNYRTGAMHDMKALTRAAHDAGALVVWDLAHSAGAVPVDLHDADADFAVGCGYKYLNGGPGAPAFLWVHPRHVERFTQPLSGWMGHAAPFSFGPHYAPAAGVDRFLCGTPAILSMAALECGIASLASLDGAADPMPALRAKSIALTDLFIEQVEARCGDALTLATPRDPAQRGSQVSFFARGALAGHGYALMQALIECGVIGDFRKGRSDDGNSGGNSGDNGSGDILRFGFAPAYLRYVDVFDAAEAIGDALASEAYRDPRFQVRRAVT